MKKRMSRILSILLVSALVVSTGSVVQAEDVEEPAAEVQLADETEEPVAEEPEAVAEPVEEVKEEAPAVEAKEEVKAEDKKEETPAEETEPEIGMDALSASGAQVLDSVDISGMSKDLSAQAYVQKAIPVKTAPTGNETLTKEEIGVVAYSTEEDDLGNQKFGYSQKFTVSSKGVLDFAVGVVTGTKTVYFGVFRDAALTQELGKGYVSGEKNTKNVYVTIPSAGTYYFGVYSIGSSVSPAAVGVAAGAMFYNGADRAISNGQTIAVGKENVQTNYFKFKAPYTGYLKTAGDTTASLYKVTLCNGSKKALSGADYLRYNPTYGVTKGKTYYIKVVSNGNSKGVYTFKVTSKKITEKSGKKKSKAVTIKRKKTKKGTIQAGSGQSDWYKFKLTKKQNVKISLSTGSNDALKVIVYKGGKKIGSRTIYRNAKGYVKSLGKWPKGTYYIQMKRANKKSSGYYTLKWQ